MRASSESGELNAAAEELTKASHHLAEIMYQKTAGQTPPPGGPAGADQAGGGPKSGSGKKEDEVIDAEYVDMDKNE